MAGWGKLEREMGMKWRGQAGDSVPVAALAGLAGHPVARQDLLRDGGDKRGQPAGERPWTHLEFW